MLLLFCFRTMPRRGYLLAFLLKYFFVVSLADSVFIILLNYQRHNKKFAKKKKKKKKMRHGQAKNPHLSHATKLFVISSINTIW